MQHMCDMNFVIDLTHCGVSEAQWLEHESTKSKGLRFDSSWGLRIFSLSHARNKMKKTIFLQGEKCQSIVNPPWVNITIGGNSGEGRVVFQQLARGLPASWHSSFCPHLWRGIPEGDHQLCHSLSKYQMSNTTKGFSHFLYEGGYRSQSYQKNPFTKL